MNYPNCRAGFNEGAGVRIVRTGILVLLSSVSLTAKLHAGEGVLQFGGKSLTAEELPPAIRGQLFDAQQESYLKQKQILENALLEMELDKRAAKEKITRAELEKKIFAISEPTEADAKKWFESNKQAVQGYPFDQIKGQIIGFLKNSKVTEKRQAELDKMLKEKGNSISLVEPKAPVVQIQSSGFPVKGNTSSKVVIVEFADYQCPHCLHAYESMKAIWKDFKDKVQFVYMDYPVNSSGISRTVAEASVCAQEQGKYWEFHEMAFEGQAKLTKESPRQFAEKLKLDVKKFDACVAQGKGKAIVDKSKAEGDRVGVSGTPTIFINGRKLANGTKEGMADAINQALKG